MLKLLLRKWWLVLIQGILLIALAVYIFNNPVEALEGISIWIGVLILATGVLGIISWFAAEKQDKKSISILWNILTALFGLLILLNLFATMKVITAIFGLWMLFTGFHLIEKGLSIKKDHSYGWAIIVAGILSGVAGVMMIFNIGTGATGISILLGVQVLVAGIALVIFAFVKRAIVNKLKNELKAVYSRIAKN